MFLKSIASKVLTMACTSAMVLSNIASANSLLVEAESYTTWQEAYRSTLIDTYGLNTTNVRFNLAYIDDDDVPELIVGEDSAHAYGVSIYGYHDGKLDTYFNRYDSNHFGEYSTLTYIPNTGIVVSDYAGMGVEEMDIYQMEGGNMVAKDLYLIEFATLHLDDYWGLDNENTDYNSDYYLYYKDEIEDQNMISYDEFKSGIEKYGIKNYMVNNNTVSNGYDSNSNLTLMSYEEGMYDLNSENLNSLIEATDTPDDTEPETPTSNDPYYSIVSDYIAEYSSQQYYFAYDYILNDINLDGNLDLIVRTGDCEANFKWVVYTVDSNNQNPKQLGEIDGMHTCLYKSISDSVLWTTAKFGGAENQQCIFRYSISDTITQTDDYTYTLTPEQESTIGHYSLNLDPDIVFLNVNTMDNYSYADTGVTNADSSQTLQDYLNSIGYYDDTTTTQPTSIIDINDPKYDDYRQAFAEFLKSGGYSVIEDLKKETGTPQFALTYIDDDNIPELVLIYPKDGKISNGATYYVFSYHDGKISYVGKFTDMGYDEKKDVIVSNDSNSNTQEVFSIEDGQAKKQYSLSQDGDQYYVDDSSVSKKEYDQKSKATNDCIYDYDWHEANDDNVDRYITGNGSNTTKSAETEVGTTTIARKYMNGDEDPNSNLTTNNTLPRSTNKKKLVLVLSLVGVLDVVILLLKNRLK